VRAEQETNWGRRDVAGCVFGALQPATGTAFAATRERRTAANRVDLLARVEGWIGPAGERIYEVVDDRNVHGGTDRRQRRGQLRHPAISPPARCSARGVHAAALGRV